MISLAKLYIRHDEKVKELENLLKEAKAARDNVSRQLVSTMTDEEVQNLNVLGKNLYLNTRTTASPAAGRRPELFKALEVNGYADIVKPNVNANTLSATVREMMEQNAGELPPWLEGLVTLYSETHIGIRKG